jgi:hypothetical protein
MAREDTGKVERRDAHYVTTHQANDDGFGCSESPDLGLEDVLSNVAPS